MLFQKNIVKKYLAGVPKEQTDQDGAILLDDKVIGVIELKDHKTQDLSKISLFYRIL